MRKSDRDRDRLRQVSALAVVVVSIYYIVVQIRNQLFVTGFLDFCDVKLLLVIIYCKIFIVVAFILCF